MRSGTSGRLPLASDNTTSRVWVSAFPVSVPGSEIKMIWRLSDKIRFVEKEIYHFIDQVLIEWEKNIV